MILNDLLKSETWIKIRDFKLDEPGVGYPFSEKLARENNWPKVFTNRAIEEYKKFIYLCAVSPQGASPSPVVDKVWHLHLTYTTSYWQDLCSKTLGKEIHHYPSKGGEQEKDKHQDWYNETLKLYKAVFGQDPPPDIWPPATNRGSAYTDSPQIDIPNRFTFQSVWSALLLPIIPFIVIKIIYNQPDPFELNGPHFLVFSALLIACSFAGLLLYLLRRKRVVIDFVEENLPKQYTIYQAAYFLYGRNRAVQTAIIDGLKKDAIELQADNNFYVQLNNYDYSRNTNPLLRLLLPYEHSSLTYSQINNLLPEDVFQQPAFNNLRRIAYKKRYEHWIFLTPLAIIFVARFVQGIGNDKPVFFLGLASIITAIACTALASNYSIRQVIYSRCRQKFEEEPLANMKLNTIDEILRSHVTSGTAAVNGFREYTSLALIFGAYPIANHFNNGRAYGTGGDGGGCSSGGAGSGCGGGDGGGCGGCGGD